MSGLPESDINVFWHNEDNSVINTFSKRFSKSGTFYYTTGLLDSESVFSSGTIKVTTPPDKSYALSVLVGEIDAETETSTFVTYSWKATPIVTSATFLNNNNGIDTSPGAKLSLKLNLDHLSERYNGLIEKSEISVGEYFCTEVIYHADTSSIICTVQPDNTLVVTKEHFISFRTDYTGLAEFDEMVTRFFKFSPIMLSASPTKFSRLGNVDFILEGLGFIAELSTQVIFKSISKELVCDMKVLTYSQITCNLPHITSTLQEQETLFDIFLRFGPTDYFMGQIGSENSKTGIIMDVQPRRVSYKADMLTITFSNISAEQLFITIGDIPCEIDLTTESSNTVICHTGTHVVGVYEVQFKSIFGDVQVEDIFLIERIFDAISISPNIGLVKGGTLVTVSGYGFDNNMVIEVFAEGGERLCEFCSISPKSTFNELIFYTPRALIAQTAVVLLRHEFVDGSKSFSFYYEEANGSITTLETTMALVKGGEVVTYIHDGVILNCNTVTIEIAIPHNPCAVGAHECHRDATCTQTTDGLDYQCSCPTLSNRANYGTGRDCYFFERPLEATLLSNAEQSCLDIKRGFKIFNVNSLYHEEIIKSFMIKNEGGNSRGVFVKWYGETRCLKLARTDGGELEITFPTEECDVWGNESLQFRKKSICVRQTYRNCIENIDDTGRNTYFGKVDTTSSGYKCNQWDTSQWNSTTYPTADLTANHCRIPFPSKGASAWCPVKIGLQEFAEPCGIPWCSAMEQRLTKQTCTISTLATEYDQTTSFHSGEGGSTKCYLGATRPGNKALLSPRLCSVWHRHATEFRFEAVDVASSKYKIIRNDLVAKRYNYNEDHIIANPLSTNQLRLTSSANEINSQNVIFTISRDNIGYTVRFEEYYLSAPKSGDVLLIHQDEVGAEDEIWWSLDCKFENNGSLVKSTNLPYDVVSTITPLCSNNNVVAVLPQLPAGTYKAILRSDLGIHDPVIDLAYTINIISTLPTKIGTNGGVRITIEATALLDDTLANLCGQFLEMIFFTASSFNSTAKAVYDVGVIHSNCTQSLQLTSIDHVTGYVIDSKESTSKMEHVHIIIDQNIVPVILSITPSFGATAGGTPITIGGTGFKSDITDVYVTISQAECIVRSVIDTEIVCITSAVGPGITYSPTAPIVLIDQGPGIAVMDTEDKFWYIDQWSSPFTWGCEDDTCKPIAGDIVVIPANHTILLDETTPLLSALVIDGGRMIWARKDGIELHLQYGIVTAGGSFEIGTEKDPFCSGKAKITLYGNQRSTNLPIYGAKVFAVRFGQFSMHGCPKTTTWTELNKTAEIGHSTITLTHPE